MKEKINVLSLFDGISAGQLALQRAGIEVNNYYASEIDKYAIQVTQKNFPNTIQLGDITKWKEWDIDWSKIDLVIGGSPCQGFSFAGKQLNFDDPRSKLFFVFVDICHRVIDENPKMKFLLENVRMKKEYQDVITKYMGVEPVAINSSLVSAQNRYRLYWTNISDVTQPNDFNILLRDIILDDVDEKYYYSKTVLDRIDVSEIEHVGMFGYKSKGKEMDKCGALLARHYKGMQSFPFPIVKEKIRITGAAQRGRYLVNGKRADHTVDSMTGLTEQRIEFREDGKSNCLTSVQKDSLVGILKIPEATKKGYTEVYPNEGVDLTFINSTTRRGRRMEDKSNCLTAANYDYCWYDGYICRKLTPIECERLQTFPDNWTEGVSDTQRYKALGNSWTVDVIAHIFKGL
jgi:DNA (cytosine-5)-methyltransferase 3A